MKYLYAVAAIAILLASTLSGGWSQQANAATKKPPHTVLSAQVGGVSLTLTVADCHKTWQPKGLPA